MNINTAKTARRLTRALAKRLVYAPSYAWQPLSPLDFEISEAELMADLEFGRDCDENDDWVHVFANSDPAPAKKREQ